MLRNTTQLEGFTIRATDGELGTVDQLYFDDETWAIRYLTVATTWLGGRRVLISPISVVHTDWRDKRVDVALTKKQVENSPIIDTDKPISRQHEIMYSGYYGYPYYWGGAFLGGASKLSGRCRHGIQAFYRAYPGQSRERDGFASAKYQSRYRLSH